MAKGQKTGYGGVAPYPYEPIGSAEKLAASGKLSEFDWPEPPEYQGKTPPMDPNVRIDSDRRI